MTAATFHAGERAVQQRVGVAERMAQVGPRVIRDFMPDQHRELFEKLPFMLMGALDVQGRPWATMLAGAPGFVHTPDAQTLDIDAMPLGLSQIPLALAAGDSLGLLGIEPATRRRNRVNGELLSVGAGGLHIGVLQSFGNCPKYINAHTPHHVEPTPGAAKAFGALLPSPARSLVQAADTFFIATASADAAEAHRAANGGVDVSHRGGKPGFVHVDEQHGAHVLTVPDFIGNFFFNTLGNITVHPRAGLLFADWTTGDLLMLTAQAEIIWNGPAVEGFAGAQRLLRLTVTEGRWLPGAMPLRAGEAEPAPQLQATGDWPSAAA